MRFVPVQCLRVGMQVGKSLYGADDELFLSKDCLLTQVHIDRIKKLQYDGIYIDYDISKDLDVLEYVVEIIKNRKVKSNSICDLDYIEVTKSIIDEILENNDIMINLIELKTFDEYTYYHSINVFRLALVMGISLELPKRDLKGLCISALLHDIGKIFIKKDILNKQGKLTKEEYDIVKTHTLLGYKKIKSIPYIDEEIAIGILDHHEKCDGTGYPNGKFEKDISLYGKIIAIIDVYEALTSDRPYRKRSSQSLTIKYMQVNCKNCLDKNIRDLFISIITSI